MGIKIITKITPLLITVFILSSANLAFAETKVFVEEYTYQASEYDSKVSCRALALEQVKRLLLEKLGTYLESETEVRNFQLTKDKIVILTAGIVRAEIIDEKWDGKAYYLKAKMAADPKDVYNSIDKLRQDRQKTKELEETRKKADEALKEIERLKQELQIAKAGKPNLGPYNEAVKRLSARDWFDKGYALGIAGRYQEAIEAYTKAIELDPNFALAYSDRSADYIYLGNHWQALRDCDRAIELDPKLAGAYINRGVAYENLGDYKQAIRNYDKAIELDPKIANAYNNRGFAYYELGDHRQAIRDYERAIELDPRYAWAYTNRGAAYGELGDYRQAIRDCDKAIELDPKYAKAYYNRGVAYGLLKNFEQAINDLKIAARLGHKGAQDFLKSKGVSW
jgi:tetratricopeptide (TPR) repeat protein